MESSLDIDEILIAAGSKGGEIGSIIETAERKKIRIGTVSRTDLDKITSNAKHQGIVAYYKAIPLKSIEDLVSSNSDSDPKPVIILDGVEDPHNLGAIIRSAEVLGALGVVIRKRRSAGVTPLTVKASAGAVLRLPVAEESNVDQTLKYLKDAGYWIYGLDMQGSKTVWEENLSGKVGFVMGSEGKGISSLVKKRCDALLRIPQMGKIGSLNVSVSAGIAMAEWLRQRKEKRS